MSEINMLAGKSGYIAKTLLHKQTVLQSGGHSTGAGKEKAERL